MIFENDESEEQKKEGKSHTVDGVTGTELLTGTGRPAVKPWVAWSSDFVVPLIYWGTTVCPAKI